MLCYAGSAVSQTNRDLQLRFSRLFPGSTSLVEIEKQLGKPQSQEKTFEWWGGWRDGEFDGMYAPKTFESHKTGLDRVVKRTLFDLSYPEMKLVLSVFDNPWQLHSIKVETPKVSVFGVRVGNSLRSVVSRLGKGEWLTSDGSDYWWLTYEKRGVRFGFLRNVALPKYPMKLDKKRVIIKIEKFDNKVSFS